MGGEKKSSRCCTSIGLGSPPRRRGKVLVDSEIRPLHRITPAQAGKSKIRKLQDNGSTGSPPRRRGKAAGEGPAVCAAGITPAWAGKRDSQWQSRAAGRDHPRMGGEKPFLFYGGSSDSGSPPHGRGKGLGLAVNVLGDGITPAQAGKSR